MTPPIIPDHTLNPKVALEGEEKQFHEGLISLRTQETNTKQGKANVSTLVLKYLNMCRQ